MHDACLRVCCCREPSASRSQSADGLSRTVAGGAVAHLPGTRQQQAASPCRLAQAHTSMFLTPMVLWAWARNVGTAGTKETKRDCSECKVGTWCPGALGDEEAVVNTCPVKSTSFPGANRLASVIVSQGGGASHTTTRPPRARCARRTHFVQAGGSSIPARRTVGRRTRRTIVRVILDTGERRTTIACCVAPITTALEGTPRGNIWRALRNLRARPTQTRPQGAMMELTASVIQGTPNLWRLPIPVLGHPV